MAVTLYTPSNTPRFTTAANPPRLSIHPKTGRISFGSNMVSALGLKHNDRIALAIVPNGDKGCVLHIRKQDDGFPIKYSKNSHNATVQSKQLAQVFYKKLTAGLANPPQPVVFQFNSGDVIVLQSELTSLKGKLVGEHATKEETLDPSTYQRRKRPA